MPENEHTDAILNATPFGGFSTGAIAMMEENRRRTGRFLSAYWQAFGMPKPVADLYAQAFTFTMR